MTQAYRIVFLDRDSLPVTLRPPALPHEWLDFPNTRADDVVARLQGASVAVTNKVPIKREMLTHLPELKLIAVAATGVNQIDLDACHELGVAVCNIQGYARHTVPEHALMLILALSRSLLGWRSDIEAGAWQAADQFCLFNRPVRDLHGATLGILGRGSLGEGLATLCRALGMNVVYAERKGLSTARAGYLPFDEVLRCADVISLHLPAMTETHHTLSHREFALMRPHTIVVNTARGSLIDEAALAQALQQGRIGGAGLDVLSEEPPRRGNPLLDLRLPNLIVTPHCAWEGSGAMADLAEQLIGNIEAFFAGEPRNLV